MYGHVHLAADVLGRFATGQSNKHGFLDARQAKDTAHSCNLAFVQRLDRANRCESPVRRFGCGNNIQNAPGVVSCAEQDATRFFALVGKPLEKHVQLEAVAM
ncbi:hypothetical protein D3C80_1541400 [compost metagenome]